MNKLSKKKKPVSLGQAKQALAMQCSAAADAYFDAVKAHPSRKRVDRLRGEWETAIACLRVALDDLEEEGDSILDALDGEAEDEALKSPKAIKLNAAWDALLEKEDEFFALTASSSKRSRF